MKENTDKNRREAPRPEAGRRNRPFSASDAFYLLENMSDGFYMLDREGTFIYLNDVAYQILGRVGQNLVGCNAWEEFREAEAPLRDIYEAAFEKQTRFQTEIYYSPMDTWFEVVGQPVDGDRLAVYFSDISRYKSAESQLEFMAYRDDLTGLLNRRAAIETAEEWIGEGTQFAIILLDIDGFRQLNDLHGHDTGDRYIAAIAERLRELMHPGDVLTRTAGDEFMFLSNCTESAELEDWTREILRKISIPVKLTPTFNFSTTASIGVSRYPVDGLCMGELLSMADTAMYESKQRRGNCFSVYHGKMRAKLERRRIIEDDLFSGQFSSKGFHYVVQPQIDGRDGTLIGIEVLARWNHPELGQISPFEFIQVAEDSGAIELLTRHLFELILDTADRWIGRYGGIPKIAVNVTPNLLENKMFYSNLIRKLKKYAISPDWFEIEITEESELLFSERVLNNLWKCQKAGIAISIDDFGTGFSGLSYLTNFPVNKIKIDRVFINLIGKSAKSEAILKSIITLADGLGLDVIAEGVETEEQLRFLTAAGCPIVQGYYFDKPLTAEQFENKYLAGHRTPAE
ncbi:sensor domain-containing protein [Edaphobacillus lindanitolerans]|uniref:PAS domain S-box-containing protein/diguanylate cyclase (GGDEF) domain-containing protein n=1 Tax=Edaphobacillus lindanitolerans TaxID=550447 RepID=A0A1U7PPR6_9BACI|nr:GGDEF domain-containing phosphodiesterase [Edaphobacillus lindanitolerans]SIT89099.1 PAS domain S-box-containing protein/diguanylate cyclase (GGDEF) domain-containing protein [Edaphobacillus lindanitolerans]